MSSQNVSVDYDESSEQFELEQGDDCIRIGNEAAREVILALRLGVQAQERAEQ